MTMMFGVRWFASGAADAVLETNDSATTKGRRRLMVSPLLVQEEPAVIVSLSPRSASARLGFVSQNIRESANRGRQLPDISGLACGSQQTASPVYIHIVRLPSIR